MISSLVDLSFFMASRGRTEPQLLASFYSHQQVAEAVVLLLLDWTPKLSIE